MKMSREKVCFGICLILCIILCAAFTTPLFHQKPTASSQLFAVREDGTTQEIASAEQESENLDFSRNLMKDLENLEWVDEAIVFCEHSGGTPTYQVAVTYDSDNGDWYEDILTSLEQYVTDFSVTDKTVYENQIQLTFVME